LLNREVLGNPKLIEPNELRQVASVVCFDLHLRIAIGSLTLELSGRHPRPLQMRNDAGGPLERTVRWAPAGRCLA
jgi:hypothetical protein